MIHYPLPGRYTRTRFPATEGESTEISNIHIPPLRNAYLNCKDSFLTFSVTATVEGTLLPQSDGQSGGIIYYLTPVVHVVSFAP